MKRPTISMLVVTYNRSQIVGRAIESILAQTFQDFEIILVNNGCTDNTDEVLTQYKSHEKVRYFALAENKGAAVGFNFAFDQIQGEWFTLLPDDDELFPKAFETLLDIPYTIDPSIDAVSCNCEDSATGAYSGLGLEESQYLDLEKIVLKCSGEFWGITKTELLGDKRLNEDLIGYENAFWYQIDAITKRYYLHQALRIFHTDHEFRMSMTNESHLRKLSRKVQLYKELLNEDFFWQVMKTYNPSEFHLRSFNGWLFLKMGQDKLGSNRYKQKMAEMEGLNKYKFFRLLFNLLGNRISKFLYERNFI